MGDHPTRLRGRHVVVTGAGTGIGRAIALRLAAEGARVSLLARDAARLEATAARIVAAGGDAPHVDRCDIRVAADVERAVATAVDAGGALHAFVANAGIG